MKTKVIRISAMAIFALAFLINVQSNLNGNVVVFGKTLIANTGTGAGPTDTGTGTGYEKAVVDISQTHEISWQGELECRRTKTRSVITCIGTGTTGCTASDTESKWSDWKCKEL